MNKILVPLIILLAFLVAPFTVEAEAFLYLTPPKTNFNVDDEFFVSIKLNTGGTPVNAVKTVVYFPKDKLSIINISKDGSIFSLWPEEPKFSNDSGEISFLGGLPHPGFNGSDGQLLSIKFKAKDRGSVNLNFGESAVLASDGRGTNIFSYGEKANYILKPIAPEVFSSTHLDEEKWYSNKRLELEWKLSSDITDVSFVLDKNTDSEPDNISEGKLNSKTYQDLDDGIWYFHLKTKDALGWSAARHFAVNIDTVLPRPFEIAVNNEGDSTNPRPILYFDVSDETSGIDYYRIEFENGDSVILANPGINQYQLPPQEPGTKSIVIEAYDKAGNFRKNVAGVVIHPIEKPIVTIWPRIYTAGEERFYVEGEAIPQAEITIFLEKGGNIAKEWKALSGKQGAWKFSTTELLESGVYNLFTKARDMRGALSELSSKQEIEVILSGIVLGSLMITYRNLVSILAVILVLLISVAIYFITKSLKHRKILRRETKEAEQGLHQGFSALRDEIVKELKKLEGVKSGRELSEREQEIIKNLKNDLSRVEKFIGKEIKDVEKELQ